MRGRTISKLIRSSELAIMGAIFIIGLGLLGIFLSIAGGLNPTVLSGRIFIACGLAYFVYAFATWDDGEAVWRVLMSFLYGFCGLYLLLFFSPDLQARNVMVVVGVVVLIEGVMQFLIFYRLRAREGSGWIAAGGIATTFLVLIVCGLWPVSSMRLIGGIVGTELIISGVSRLMYSVATHKSLEAIARRERRPHDTNLGCV